MRPHGEKQNRLRAFILAEFEENSQIVAGAAGLYAVEIAFKFVRLEPRIECILL